MRFTKSGIHNHRPVFWMASLLLLPASVAAAAAQAPDVSFASDFTSDSRLGKWAHAHAARPDRLSVSESEMNHGKKAVLVDVHPGENRAELLNMRSDQGRVLYETPDSNTQYFAMSYKFPKDFVAIKRDTRNTWQIILQLHGPDSLKAPPSFALDVAGGRYVARTNGGDLAAGNRYVAKELSDSSLNLGHWTDFVIRIKFATDDTGGVTIWRRNENEVQFRQVLDIQKVATLQYNSGRDIGAPGRHYWKQGMYRSSMRVRNTFWMGPIARAGAFQSAEEAAFGTTAGMPR